jgi:hypothetical protein
VRVLVAVDLPTAIQAEEITALRVLSPLAFLARERLTAHAVSGGVPEPTLGAALYFQFCFTSAHSARSIST